jgi:hypothetical protein
VGMIRRMKDMKDMVNAAPGMVAQAQQLGAQAQQMAAAQQSAMQARMADVSQMMEMQTQAASTAAAGAGGFATRCPVVIVGMRQVGSVNFDLLVEFELTVTPEGMPPYPATTRQLVNQFQVGQLQPGRTLLATVDASNPVAIWLDFASLR